MVINNYMNSSWDIRSQNNSTWHWCNQLNIGAASDATCRSGVGSELRTVSHPCRKPRDPLSNDPRSGLQTNQQLSKWTEATWQNAYRFQWQTKTNTSQKPWTIWNNVWFALILSTICFQVNLLHHFQPWTSFWSVSELSQISGRLTFRVNLWTLEIWRSRPCYTTKNISN